MIHFAARLHASHSYYPAIIYIDLDNFKHINDTDGNWVGDEALKKARVDTRCLSSNRHKK